MTHRSTWNSPKTWALAAVAALALAAAPAARAEGAPGEFQIPGTQSFLKLYGFVQLDTTVDFAGRPVGYEGSDWATFLGAVPEDHSAAAKRVKPQTYFTLRTSRFGFQTRTPTKLGELKVRLEGDFNAPNDFQSETYTHSMLFRLRHAYAAVGGLLVGQTWSTFFDLDACPDTVDFNGPGTQAFNRAPMVRYTFGLNEKMNLAVALENNRGPQYGVDTRFQTIPDLHAAYSWAPAWGTLSLRGVLQFYNRASIGIDGDYADVAAKHKVGVGVSASGSVKVGQQDGLVWLVAGGPGIGRYLFNTATIGDAGPGVSFDDATGKITLWNVWGAHVGYKHVWNPQWRSSLVLAYTRVLDPKVGGVEATNDVQKDFLQGFANAFYTMSPTSSIGVEYAYGRWNSFTNGTPQLHGTQHRINASFHYDFY